MKRIYRKIRNEIIHKYWVKFKSPKLEEFRNKHKGEDCFIIGNGPSLNEMDLSLLNDYHTFGLNKIHLIFDRKPFDLSYHVAVNPYVIEQIKKEIVNLNCDSFLSYTPALINRITSKNIYYLGDTKSNEFFYKDITKGMRQGNTVTYVAMQLAYFMGFKNIYLIGVDHNFSQQGKPNEKQKMSGNDPNHFDPNYFKGQVWQLADLEGSEIHYLLAKYFFEKDNRNIFDATYMGKLDVFQKISFEKALSLAAKKK